MKKLLLLSIAILLFSASSYAQNSIQLNIHHKLGSEDFAMETATKNNLDHDFEVTRLQYYISEISIVHDGGMETMFDDFWVLVNASETTQVDLEDSNINSVEMVKLHIGVDPDHNHEDPASYPSTHPLAPQAPSMHWGWVAGYRFAAIEGNGGSNFNQSIEIHALGNGNYFTTEIPLAVEASNNEVVINLDADYTRTLEDLSVNGGLIVHSEEGAAIDCLENFRDFVFSASSMTNATIDFSEVSHFEAFPNPTTDRIATIELATTGDLIYAISVTDILGSQVAYHDAVNSNTTTTLELKEAGFYFVNLIKEGQPVITKKLIAQ